MTRRFADFSRPDRQPYTWVDWFLIGVVSVVCTAALVFILFIGLLVKPAWPRDLGQWENSDPIISQWYKTLMQPDNPSISCCGKADAYWADQVEVKNGRVYATITDDRDDVPLGRRHLPKGTVFEVPPHKMKFDRGNPTGHVVIFISMTDQVLCFVQGGGV